MAHILEINLEKCNAPETGCRECVDICPAAVWEIGYGGKANPAHTQDCTECQSCQEICPMKAITVAIY